MDATRLFRGTAFTCDAADRVLTLRDQLFVVDAAGVIVRCLPADDPDAVALLAGRADVVHLRPGQYWLPGFVDLHVHAPQWAQAGRALDEPLETWLQRYTFPLEARFADLAWAERVYRSLVTTMLSLGTTTALYFATVHRPASLILAELCAELGQRGLVGKVAMDHPDATPPGYRDRSAQSAVTETDAFIVDVLELRARTGAEVYPVVTPRFIPSCTDEALRGLGELAARHGVHVQSHCSESDWEHAHVRQRFGRSDASALNSFGLLGQRSVMAHCGFLDADDTALFAATGTAVAHCPLSNGFFAGAVTPVRRFLDAGVQVGLGTDISGGYSPSSWDALRQAVLASRLLESGVDARLDADARGVRDSRLTFEQAFALATAGGGRALDLPIGRLAEGYAWDAQLVDVRTPGAVLPVFDDEDHDHILHTIIALAAPENVRSVWVQGRRVTSRD